MPQRNEVKETVALVQDSDTRCCGVGFWNYSRLDVVCVYRSQVFSVCYESVTASPGDDPEAAAAAPPGYSGTQDIGDRFWKVIFRVLWK